MVRLLPLFAFILSPVRRSTSQPYHVENLAPSLTINCTNRFQALAMTLWDPIDWKKGQEAAGKAVAKRAGPKAAKSPKGKKLNT